MPANADHSHPFSFDLSRCHVAVRQLGRLAATVAERALGLTGLNAVYARCRAGGGEATLPRFSDRVLAEMGVGVEVGDRDLARIPGTGPLMLTANHPFGAIEGLALASLVQRVRSDIKVLSNYLLHRIPELRESSIFVDPFGGAAAARHNVAPLREAMQWLSAGHALLVFPAGAVAHFSLRSGRIVEPPWSANVARLAVRTDAAIVPVFVDGANSFWFQALGTLHPRLRTALLPREFLRQRGRAINVRVGEAIPSRRLRRFEDDGGAADYLRLRSLMLAPSAADEALSPQPCDGRACGEAEIVTPQPVEAIAADIRSLPRSSLLVESGDFQVFAASAAHLPNVLFEIGRLREVTFRNAGEGTGRPIDLDRFDEHYTHLFVWDRSLRRIAGAYRLGFTTDLVSTLGLGGLYTSTLFRFDERLLRRIGPAVELGRSFVTADYQRSYSALMLLWKGIARAVSVRPEHRTLFGVVSVSADYDSMTKRLLMAFLKVNSFAPTLARLVRPLNPPRLGAWPVEGGNGAASLPRDIAQFDELARELEAGRRGVPVLLRQYLRLGAKVLGFNIDSEFGNVLDALMLVDLVQADRAILDRFFGPAAAAAFLAHHGQGSSATRRSSHVA